MAIQAIERRQIQEEADSYPALRQEAAREIGRWRKEHNLGSSEEHTKYKVAIQALKRLQAKHPSDAWAYIQQATIALAAGHYDDVLSAAEACLEKQPDTYNLRLLHAEAVAYLGDVERADQLFQSIRVGFELRPDKLLPLLIAHGRSWFHDRHFDRAEELFLEALDIDSRNGEVVTFLARLYRTTANYKECLRLLDMHPNSKSDPYLLMEKAHCYLEMKQYDIAERHLTQSYLLLQQTQNERKKQRLLPRYNSLAKMLAAVS